MAVDRGYFDCSVGPIADPEKSKQLIPLLRIIKDDENYYKDRLIELDLSRTLPSDEYASLFIENYQAIKNYLLNN